jgi:BirA family biotin operon repressor/biotin-[acetyl-CoA-carboxylase] ligase
VAVSIARGIGASLVHPELLALLADGRLRSGQGLAALLGVSRAAVWKAVERLRAQGIDVDAEPRRGYRLKGAVELFDVGRIRAELDANATAVLRSLELKFEVDSTNSHLLERRAPPYGFADVCLCELQHAGRGRRGRAWIAPFGSGLAVSLSWTFRDTIRDLPALSLCVGVALVRALSRTGARGLRLKWPNDLWFEDRKIGGVLTELRAEAGGPAHVVIGLGLNVALPPEARRAIEAAGAPYAVGALADACPEPPSRNRVVGLAVNELIAMLPEFERGGFAPFRAEWLALDALRDRSVQVVMGEDRIAGRALGVDDGGALCVSVGGRKRTFVSGEVSLRLEDQPR